VVTNIRSAILVDVIWAKRSESAISSRWARRARTSRVSAGLRQAVTVIARRSPHSGPTVRYDSTDRSQTLPTRVHSVA